MRTLMSLYRVTGKRAYLEPIPRAIAYYRRSRLPEGGLARFYELKSNRPLYFTREYKLTYDDSDLPTHYAFKVGDWVEKIAAQYERLLLQPWQPKSARADLQVPRISPSLEQRVRRVMDGLDARGAWVESGSLRYHGAGDETARIIRCRTFASNVRLLASYVAAVRQQAD
jgi:hypothetical protein